MPVQTSSRKWLFIAGGVIVAAGVTVVLRNYPPPKKDVEGTIGSAQRYHATQITGDDVKVDETEVTTWVQSETFDRIVKDPVARKLFVNQSVQQLLINDSLREYAKQNTGVVIDSAKQNTGVQIDSLKLNADQMAAARNAAIHDALRNESFCQALLNSALRQALVSYAQKFDSGGSVE